MGLWAVRLPKTSEKCSDIDYIFEKDDDHDTMKWREIRGNIDIFTQSLILRIHQTNILQNQLQLLQLSDLNLHQVH